MQRAGIFSHSLRPEELELLEEIIQSDAHDLVVYNDDINTFEHVIQTLMEVCNHTIEQAEQCTWIIHFKGKCSVKIGSFEELAGMRQSICSRGISAEVF